MKRIISILWALLLTSATVCAQQEIATLPKAAAAPQEQTAPQETEPARLWDRANTAYIDGHYGTAVELYRRILDQGLYSTKLYYNLANAYYKSGNTAEAILFYHRALRLDPGNDDIRHNLEVATSSTRDRIEAVPEFFLVTWLRAFRHTLSIGFWTALSLAALVSMLGLLLLYLLSRRISLRKTGFYGMLASLMIFIAATCFAAAGRREAVSEDRAVVMSASLPVKSSPGSGATDLFVLHEGTCVRITDRLDAWYEIVIADGKKGWVDASRLEVI